MRDMRTGDAGIARVVPTPVPPWSVVASGNGTALWQRNGYMTETAIWSHVATSDSFSPGHREFDRA
jgi:uncharacterized membrane protein